MAALPTQERLLKLLSYEPETGILTWKRRGLDEFADTPSPLRLMRSWNSKYAGQEAGCHKGDGYIIMSIDDVRHRAHRVIWVMVTGKAPSADVDHINGVRDDNRWENLRDVDRSTNLENRRSASSRSSTGMLGIGAVKRTGKYIAQIKVKGEHTHLGTFGSPEEAHEAYVAAKRGLHAGCTI